MEKGLEQKELPIQFNYIDKANELLLNWTKQSRIVLINIQYIVPFVLSDKSISVYFFYDKNKTMNDYQQNGTNELVKKKYLKILKILNYPSEYLNEITFEIDSDENVTENYEGSYFNRLR